MYEGWMIYTYTRKISQAEESTIMDKLKTWFDTEECSFSADTLRIVCGQDKQEITVSFHETKYGSEKDGNVDTYQMVFWSIPFLYKTSQEKTHQELCKETMQKIPWKKQAFWLVDNVQIPIQGTKRLRMK